MLKALRYLAAAVPILAASFAFGEITGSKHDFSGANWSDQQICKPCHTPHNADVSLTGRIWAHTLSTATYTAHGGTAAAAGTAKWVDGTTRLDAATNTLTQDDLDAASRLCLSCHDGTVALDSFKGKDGGSTGKSISDLAGNNGLYNPNLGGVAVGATVANLSNDHPVGYKTIFDESKKYGTEMPYKPLANVLGKGLVLAQTTTAIAGGYTYRTGDIIPASEGGDGVKVYAAPTYTKQVSVSCVTCHDVHNGKGNTKGLLKMDNTGSALCLTCHNK